MRQTSNWSQALDTVIPQRRRVKNKLTSPAATQPSNVLHVCNISPTTTIEELATAVTAAGAVSHDFDPKVREYGSVRFPTVQAAAAGLMQLHRKQVGNSTLRAAYAKTPPAAFVNEES